MKILTIQNRMGIGDMVIFLPFIEAISKKFNFPVSILVKENSKASEYIEKNKYIEKILILERNNNNNNHDGIIGSFNLARDLKKEKFDKVFIFNSSLRFHLICKMAGIKEIFQYPLFKKKNQHLIKTAQSFIKKELDMDIESNPIINLDDSKIENAIKKYNIEKEKVNILLGIGGSGPTKRIPAHKFLDFMRISIREFNCKFFLATGTKKEEQDILNEILNSEFKQKCTPLDKIKINEILPVIKNCNIAICNDSSLSNLSSGLGKQAIVLMSDTPLIYGNYSSKMYPLIPDGVENITPETEGKERINPLKIFEKFQTLIS